LIVPWIPNGHDRDPSGFHKWVEMPLASLPTGGAFAYARRQMTSEPLPPKRIQGPSFGRGWASLGPAPASRSEMIPVPPDQLSAEREARWGLNPPRVTIRRVG